MMAVADIFMSQGYLCPWLHHVNFHAPARLFRVKRRDNLLMSQEIQNLIYLRDNLHKRAVKNNDAAI